MVTAMGIGRQALTDVGSTHAETTETRINSNSII